MPDYDPESIPILDDIIEKKTDADDDGIKTQETESSDTDNNLELFPDATLTAYMPTDEIIATDEPATEIVTGHDETFDNLRVSDKNETYRYTPTTPDNDSLPLESAMTDNGALQTSTASEPVSSEQNIEPAPEASRTTSPPETICLQSITDDIVQKLMPDLEYQLRHLIQQTLKEKLPEEILKQTDLSTSNADVTNRD